MLNIYLIDLPNLLLQPYMLTWENIFDSIKTTAPEVLFFTDNESGWSKQHTTKKNNYMLTWHSMFLLGPL